MLVTAPDHSFNPQETTQGVTNTPSTPKESPSIDLPDDYSHGFNKCYIKRQRVNCDGKYSPCPSPNSSLSPSPFPSPAEISASSTPSPAWLSPQPPPLSQAILEPNNKTKDRACILDKLMADLGTVFNAETLKEVDQEVCFGMIPGNITSTHQNLCLLQKSYAEIACPPPFVLLNLKFPPVSNSEVPVNVTFHAGPNDSMLGDLDKLLSIALLRLLGYSLVRVQALILPPFASSSGRRKTPQQKLDIIINLYGNQKHATRVGRFLSKNKFFLQHPNFPEPGHVYKNPHFLSKPGALTLITKSTLTGGVLPTKGTKKNTEREIPTDTTKLSKFFDGLCKSETLNEHGGDSRLTTPLLRHQKQGLYFLMKRELGLSTLGSHGCQLSRQRQHSVRGGILADYMGLGKTLTILSLIVGSLEEARGIAYSQRSNSGSAPINSGATLLIAPIGTLGNWEAQIAAHMRPNTLKYYIYHGKDKVTDPQALSDYDIVFTSFGTATREWAATQNSPLRGPLYSINWFRLILDEAHEIRTQKTSKCQAICALIAERRWCVTGTPLQNDIIDIATLFKFLRYELHTEMSFDRDVVAKIKAGDDSGMENLRAMLKSMCLRRTKDTISGILPARREEIKYLEFNSDEKALYDSYKKSNWDFPQHATGVNTLQVQLGLRLICDHGKDLLPQGELELLCSNCKVRLGGWEAEFGSQIPCVHRALCQRCTYNLEATDDKEVETLDLGCQQCFESRRPLGNSMLAAFPNYQGPSTKVRTLIASIHQCTSADYTASVYPVSKHVVFSSWTRMLDLVGIALKQNEIPFCRLDGSMSRSQREQTLAEFATNPSIFVILVSLMAGGVGINLTCASRVHILEPHWNPMIEQQAVERVHRLGQTRDVVITRYIMDHSFEIDMLNRQKRKLELARQSLDTSVVIATTEDVDMG